MQFSMITFEEDEQRAFRNVHFVKQQRRVIKSRLEAKQILEDRPSDPSALQYLGWWNLVEKSNPEATILYLTSSVASGKGLSSDLFLPGFSS